jgi:sirohydrochlorin ferrochelatase
MTSLARKTLILAPIALLIGGSLAFAQVTPATAPHKEAMHMHKSDVTHMGTDAEVAKEFKDEATLLREQAESHRKLAEMYKTRTSPKGGSYANVAAHCEKLAKSYEEAAKAAEAASAELGKK